MGCSTSRRSRHLLHGLAPIGAVADTFEVPEVGDDRLGLSEVGLHVRGALHVAGIQRMIIGLSEPCRRRFGCSPRVAQEPLQARLPATVYDRVELSSREVNAAMRSKPSRRSSREAAYDRRTWLSAVPVLKSRPGVIAT